MYPSETKPSELRRESEVSRELQRLHDAIGVHFERIGQVEERLSSILRGVGLKSQPNPDSAKDVGPSTILGNQLYDGVSRIYMATNQLQEILNRIEL